MSDAPTTKLASGKLLIHPQAPGGHGLASVDSKLQFLWFQGPLIPSEFGVEDNSLQSDDEFTSGNESEQEDAGSEENILSGSDSDDN